MNNVAIVGAGIIGMTNAIRLLEQGFSVIIFTKDEPLNTNSDVAVANWFTPDDSKPLLQRYCLESITKFSELMDTEEKVLVLGYTEFHSSFILKVKKILRKAFGQENL